MANEAGVRYLGDQGSSGTCLGYTTTSTIGFHGATPVNKPGTTEDLKDLLVAYGLMTTGGATPLNLDGGALTADSATVTSLSVSGAASFASNVDITASGDLTLDGITATSLAVSGLASFSSKIDIIDTDVDLAATTGTKIGTATDQKLGFWNVTPVVQPVGAGQAAVSVSAGTTALSSTTIASIHSLASANKTLVNAIRTGLVAAGVIKGAA